MIKLKKIKMWDEDYKPIATIKGNDIKKMRKALEEIFKKLE